MPDRRKNKNLIYHGLALLTVIIWGTTFVSTKILIRTGLSPVEIFLYRFLLAYVCILTVSHSRLVAKNRKDEFFLFLAGICGGSLYFILENTALGITLASNVSLLICTAPVITAFLAALFYKESFRKKMLLGSAVALVGVGLVVFNGSIVLKINPAGDLLTLGAAVSWAFYCLILKRLGGSYPILFITRKVFFYGLLSLLIYCLFFPLEFETALLSRPVVYGNLLFLGVVASMLCYIMWNTAVKFLGAAKTTNYIYIVPLVTLLTSAFFLSETVTLASLTGALLIIGGVYAAEKK